MDRLGTMAMFLAVVDEGGFAAAARKLQVSPPVVTRAVTELEEAMGVRLLTRTTRVVRVTDVGQRYATDCRRILQDVADSEQAAAGTHAEPRGKLVVTSSVLFGAMYVTPIVTEYLRRYPHADVECRFLDRVVNLMDEGVDVAIRIGHLPDSSFHAVKVGQVRLVVCASPSYLAARGIPLAPEDLAEHDIVVARALTPSPEWRFEGGREARSVRIEPRMSSTSNDAALAAVADGFGLTRVLSYMAAPRLTDGQLKIVLSQFEAAPMPVSVVHHEGRRATPKVRAFIDLAVGMLRANTALN